MTLTVTVTRLGNYCDFDSFEKKDQHLSDENFYICVFLFLLKTGTAVFYRVPTNVFLFSKNKKIYQNCTITVNCIGVLKL